MAATERMAGCAALHPPDARSAHGEAGPQPGALLQGQQRRWFLSAEQTSMPLSFAGLLQMQKSPLPDPEPGSDSKGLLPPHTLPEGGGGGLMRGWSTTIVRL